MPYDYPRINKPVKIIIIVNVVIYMLTLLPGIGRYIIDWGSLIPLETFSHLQLWRLVTYMFLHDPNSVLHLFFNMLALWMFSQEIEELWGSRRFTWFYFISGIGAGLFSLIHLYLPGMNMVGVIGASGAVLALLTVYAHYFPQRNILLFFIIPVNIRVVVIGYALISLFGTISPHGVVSHVTHLGGIIIAMIYLKWYDVLITWIRSEKSRRGERILRKNAETEAFKRRFFEEEIDPILKKISREGSASLTPREKKLLEDVKKSKERDRLKKGKIIPFDFFK